MSLFAATLVFGLILIALGFPLLINHPGVTAAIKAFPRSTSAGYVVFFAVALLSFKCVPDFLGVRGACALVLTGAMPFLDAAYMQYDRPLRLFMVSFVYVAISLAIWLGAQPWRLRDFLNWLFSRPARSRSLGGVLVAYGFLLCGVALTFR
jgi:hypothetical protein